MDPEASAFDDDTPMEEEKKDYNSEDFKFMQMLEVHSGSVKAVAVNNTGLMMSGSIDQSCKLFSLDDTSGKYQFLQELHHHDHYVYCVAAEINNKGFFTCGKDARIFLVDNDGNPVKMYEGHSSLVNMVAQIDDKTLLSGSWDGTAKVWNIETAECIKTLEGNSHAVAIFVAPNGNIITGSQDKTIRIWNKNSYSLYKEWQGHDDIIRQFADFSPVGFVSCSNDSKVKIWTYEGELISELTGHTGFVFTVHTLPNNIIISGSDDRTLKLWKDCICVQTVQFPATVWDIKSNSLGDIVVAAEDYKIYLFTRDPSRAAKDKELLEYNNSLTSKGDGEQIDLATIPSADKMSQYTGKSEGEFKIFKEGNVPQAYMWKTDEHRWELVGEVQMPSSEPPAAATKMYEGDRLFEAGEYDHVFDVEIGDGNMRKLPFDNGGNVDDAANKFCTREGFGKSNIEQIIKFIKTNSLPYGTREIVSASKDPNAQKPKLKHIPMLTYLYFDSVNVTGPEKKLREINTELGSIEEKEMKHFEKLLQVIGEKQFYHTSEIYKQEWDVFRKMLAWPNKHLFPVLDLFRMFLLHSQSSEMFKVYEQGDSLCTKLLGILHNKDEPTANHLLTLRCLCNMFNHPSSTFVLMQKYEKIIDAITDYVVHENKNIRNAAITILLNYSIGFLSRKEDNQGRVQIIACLVDAFDQESDAQNFMRITATVGNLLFEDDEVTGLARDFGIAGKLSSVEKFKGKDIHDKCSKLAEEIHLLVA
jgi:phospholipase A-2-activating protein